MAVAIDHRDFVRPDPIHIDRFDRRPPRGKIVAVLEMRVVVDRGVFATE